MALLGFDDFPVAEDFGGVFGAFFTEDVGMAANHFFVNFGDYVGDAEAAFFVSDLGMEKDLEKEVAKFFSEFGVIGAVEGVEDFVGFFDEIGAEGGVGLFAVPGATVRSAEAGHDSDELFEGGSDGGGASGLGKARGGRRGLGSFALRFAGGHESIRRKMG